MVLTHERSEDLRRNIDAFVKDIDRAWFTTYDVWRNCSVESRDGKNVVLQRLRELVEKGELQKDGLRYRRLQKGRRMDGHADPTQTIDLRWPTGQDGTDFGLSEIQLYRKSIIVVAGVSNMGKTGFCLNMVSNNLDVWKDKIKYITNELADEELVDRLYQIGWTNCFDDNGDFRFQAVELSESWEDEIEPDWLNFIDYLDPGPESFMVGQYIDKVRNKLDNGCAVIAIQKGVHKYVDKKTNKTVYTQNDYGVGGQFSEHRARVVIHLDPYSDHLSMLTIKKAKSNLTGRRFTYALYNKGIEFREIQELTEE
jgi:hypothetical protein